MSIRKVDGVRDGVLAVPGGHIHAVELGDGPLVLLIHGFPEGWWSWRHQLPALAAAGFRAVAIDVRSYGGSSRPAEVEAYRMVALVADMVGVVRALAAGTAVVIGQDWAPLRPGIFKTISTLRVSTPKLEEMCPKVGARWADASVTPPAFIYCSSGIPAPDLLGSGDADDRPRVAAPSWVIGGRPSRRGCWPSSWPGGRRRGGRSHSRSTRRKPS